MFEVGLHHALRKQFTRGRLRVDYPSGRSETYGGAIPHNRTAPVSAVRITDAAALRRIARDPGLGVAEMYMEGRLVIEEGDIYDLLDIARLNSPAAPDTGLSRLGHFLRNFNAASALRAIGLRRARQNVAHHYDLDERLYRLFLDRDMQYSCAWFEHPDMSLDAAQLAKKRLIAAKLLLRPGARVLDIGCGWGGMALYLARVCDADVTGITLSAEQHRVATDRAEAAGLSDRVRFLLEDYREIEGRFDAIVSVGMFEHVGLRQYDDYFSAAHRLLAPDGVMLLHTIAQPRAWRYAHPFIDKYIFPGGYLPAVSQILPAIEGSGLLLRDLEILSLHYADTLREWRRRVHAKRDEVVALYDERFLRMWDLYLAGSEASFRHDPLFVGHFQIARDQASVPRTRAYLQPAMDQLRRREAEIADYADLIGRPAAAGHRHAGE